MVLYIAGVCIRALDFYDCNYIGKELLRDPTGLEPTAVNNKLEIIEKAIAENHASAANIQRSLKLEFEDNFSKLENSLETKLDKMLRKQKQIPCEIKTIWQTQPNIQANNLKNIMKEKLIKMKPNLAHFLFDF